MTPTNWRGRAGSYVVSEELTARIIIERTLRLDEDVWAIRYAGRCLTKNDEWEFEPQPSSRNEEFFKRARFTLAQAVKLCGDLNLWDAVYDRGTWRPA